MRLHRVAMAVAVAGLGAPLIGPALPRACAAGEQRVVVVVDFGTVKGAPPTKPAGTCLPLTDHMTGADALEARAKALGTEPPRYANSGLLCAIDGYPKKGCGERRGAGFNYWTYWKSDGNSWKFADEGPATHRQSAGTVGGWRFQHGTGAGVTEKPPRTSPAFTELCPAVAPAAAPTASATVLAATRGRSSRPSGAPTTPTTPTTVRFAPATTAPPRQLVLRRYEPDRGSARSFVWSAVAVAALAGAATVVIRRQRGRTTSGRR